eukprot:jgi/Mesvir1/26821/Mv20580-RA.1
MTDLTPTDGTVFGNQIVAGVMSADYVVSRNGLVLSRPVWDDMRVPLNSVSTKGVSPPDFVTLETTLGLIGVNSFGALTKEYSVFFELQFPHAWKAGSEIRPHVHIMKSGTAAGYAVFGLEYTWANVNDKFLPTNSALPNANVIYMCSDLLASGTIDQYKHILCANATATVGAARASITYPSARDSSMLIGRLFRQRNANGDTLAEAVYVLEMDIHIQQDSMGSYYEFGTAT